MEIRNPYLISVILGLWVKAEILIILYFLLWFFESAYKNYYTFDMFLYWAISNLNWFFCAMFAFLIFRFYIDEFAAPKIKKYLKIKRKKL